MSPWSSDAWMSMRGYQVTRCGVTIQEVKMEHGPPAWHFLHSCSTQTPCAWKQTASDPVRRTGMRPLSISTSCRCERLKKCCLHLILAARALEMTVKVACAAAQIGPSSSLASPRDYVYSRIVECVCVRVCLQPHYQEMAEGRPYSAALLPAPTGVQMGRALQHEKQAGGISRCPNLTDWPMYVLALSA
jgi:hypothetical protein